jgi:murein DD-endopeptidase MepM/ murein hydrolase activator NlpD
MLHGTRGRPVLKTTLAAAVLLSTACFAATGASATTGGAGMAPPTTKQVAPTAALPLATPVLAPVAGIGQLAAGLSLRKVARGAVSAATLAYVSHQRTPQQVRVDVVRLADGLSIFTAVRTAAPEVQQTIRWNGRATRGLALDGRYEIRISLVAAPRSSTATNTPMAGGAAPDAQAPPAGSASLGSFTFLGAIFPVRGTHSYGGGAGRFGAGRAGHIHQGQDVMAACGTPLVAARGGIVAARAVQSAAGNYLVIDDPISGQSYMYAHLRMPAVVKRGQRVDTGQPIGVVGETGDATACHLHFEIWTAPGWYTGGQPIDPLATLKSWDRFS